MSFLSVQHINTGYGKKQVLFDAYLEVERGETILLVGSNGSGKSTLFKAIYGQIPLWKNNDGITGKVLFEGRDVTMIPTHCLIGAGLMYIPQKNMLFEDMTVEQNLVTILLFQA